MKTDWSKKRVTIIGGARQGQAAARWLTRHGALVTINDRRSFEQMASARSALTDLPVTWILGDHPIGILDTTDLLCLSGGVPLNNPIVVEAAHREIPISNDTQIFMETVPCPTIGITGSAGKTTTTALVGEMARNAFGNKVYVGGNIGDPLLNHVEDMQPDDLAILEISSFQLEQMTFSPHIAAVLNITPNHLDRHKTMEAYTAIKQRILEFQVENDWAVICRDDPGAWELHGKVKCHLISFGFGLINGKEDGCFLSVGILKLRKNGKETSFIHRDQIQLVGDHNVMNVLAAFSIGSAADIPVDAMREAVKDFKGVAHRLEFIREWKGSKWYNDSIATTPERTMAAIRSFSEPIILMLGGRDKDLPWEELAVLVHERVESVLVFGEATEKIVTALELAGGPLQKTIKKCKGLKEAVQEAAGMVKPGEIVLLSPGGTSFDEFLDFEERGEAFRKWVLELS